LLAYDSINYKNRQGVYGLLGAAYLFQGRDYSQALFYLLKSLKTAQLVQDTSLRLCQINNYLGVLYNEIGRSDTAVEYLSKALRVAKRHNDEQSIYLLVTNMASTYNELNLPEKALNILSLLPKRYLLADSPSEKAVVGQCYFGSYILLKQFSNAQAYCDTLLEVATKQISTLSKSNIYRLAANYYFFIKQFSKARFYLEKSSDLVKKLNRENGRIQNLRLLYKLDSAQGNFQSAFDNLLSYKAKTDSVSSVRKVRQFQVLGVEYEVGMKEDSIRLKDKDILLLTQKNKLQQATLRQSSFVKNVTIAGIIFAIIIIGLLYRQYRHKQKSNKTITQKNQQLQHYLTEKEWLLKEIHHRVKNNLQIVMSLLNSQSAYIDNEPALTAIHDSQHRVHAMSLIHQKLYNSENLSSIDMSLYIRELASYLADSFNTGQRIRFELAIEPLEMDVSQAVPLGLILNEAITNSIKYAFPNDSQGVIKITLLNTSHNKYLLEISDNGIGMPLHVNNKKPGSLGMSLMSGLSEDLDGSFAIENKNGTTIKVSFVHDLTVKPPDLVTSKFVTLN
jgi:two-component sensor histidine kinase